MRALRERVRALALPASSRMPGAQDLALLRAARAPFDDPAWGFEVKYDGYRTLALCYGEGLVKLVSRNANPLGAAFPDVVAALARLPLPCALDAELVVLRDGVPDFAALQRRGRLAREQTVRNAARDHPATLFVFDVLMIDGADTRDLPLVSRKALLKRLLALAPSPHVAFVDYLRAHGQALYAQMCDNALEGMVAKRLSSPYPRGRSAQWLKVKTPQARRGWPKRETG